MSGVVKKIDGVSEVKVSLKTGMATVKFAPSNQVKIEQVRKAVESNGFAPRAAEIRAVGTLVASGEGLLLVIGESADTLSLVDGPKGAGQMALLKRRTPGARVTVIGQLPQRPKKSTGARPTMLIQSFVEP